MIQSLPNSLVLLVIMSSLLLAQSGSFPAYPDGPADATAETDPLESCFVIARIGQQVMLSCEIIWRVNLLLEENKDKIPPHQVKQARNYLLQQELVRGLDLKLLYADFRAKLPEANLPEIQKNLIEPFEKERVPGLMKELGIERQEELEPRLEELGSTLEDLRQDFYQAMIARSWIHEAIEVNKEVTHQELLDYYRENAEKYDYPTQARWEELMVRFAEYDDQNAAWGAICEMGNAAHLVTSQAKDASQAAFAEIAREKSHGLTAEEGGLRDWTTKGALAADNIDDALFSLGVGEMSPILKTNQGFHIVRVLERKTAGRKTFTEVQTKIRNDIIGGRHDKALGSYIRELRNNTKIWTVYSGTITTADFLEAQRTGALEKADNKTIRR